PPFWAAHPPAPLRHTESRVGTVPLRASTLNAVLYDIARSLIHHGWNKLVFVNGHGSKTKVLDPLLRRVKHETGAVLGHSPALVHMDRAAQDRAQVPAWLPDAFIKKDGAPDVEFDGYQYFVFPMDHGEFSGTGVVGHPRTRTAEKGEEACERCVDLLVKAIDEFRPLQVSVTRRAFEDRV